MSQEFDNNVLDIDKQKGFYPYKYMSDSEKFKENLPTIEKLYSPLTYRKITEKEYKHVFNVSKRFEMKTMKG